MPKGKSTASGARKARPRGAKSPRCKTCGKTIRVPAGWTQGPAVRRHYWRHHRAHMQPERGER